MSEKNTSVEIQLAGQKIHLKGQGLDAEFTRRVAKLVGGRIKEVEKRSKSTVPPHQIALMALMDLGAEYLEAMQRTESFKESVEAKSKHLIEIVEEVTR